MPDVKVDLKDLTFQFEMKRTKYGWMVYVPVDSFIGGSLQLMGEYSPVETQFLRAIVKPGDVIVNAGANIGTIAIPLAEVVEDQGGKIFAFEPQWLIYKLLKFNIDINKYNKTIIPYYAAVGAKEGTVTIPVYNYIDPSNIGFGGIGKEQWKKATTGLEVKVITIDSLELPKLDLLQADVELMEQEVLEGAKNTIARHRPLLFVENDKPQGFVELIEYIRSIDYIPYWVNTYLFSTPNFYGATQNQDPWPNACSFNMYCVPKEKPWLEVEGLTEATPQDSKPGECPTSMIMTSVEKRPSE